MKILNLVLVAIFILAFTNSCTKDEDNTLDKETISAKWNVSNSSEYESFEFNESGNYLVVQNTTTESIEDQIILFGTYEIIGNSTVVLSDLGTIKISDINANSITFSIQLTSNPNNEIIITALKQEEMGSSARTDLLCRTWEMVSENGESVVGTDMELTILFSKAGTYFISYAYPEDENDGGLAQWRWKDETETKLLYSWDGVPGDGASYVEVQELTSNTLKIAEDDDVWVLKPAINTKSARRKLYNETAFKTRSKGFFKK